VPSLDTLLAALLEPHPDDVAATVPTAAQVYDAACYLGWVPAVPFLVPAVPVRAEG